MLAWFSTRKSDSLGTTSTRAGAPAREAGSIRTSRQLSENDSAEIGAWYHFWRSRAGQSGWIVGPSNRP